MASLRHFVPIALAIAAVPAGARTYCCVDDHGRRVCGDIVPVECQNRAYSELNSQGVLSTQHAAPLTTEQRAQRDADVARKKAEEQQAAENARRDRLLLGRYSSVADIDARRTRVLADATSNVTLAQERLDATLARKQKLQKEVDSFGNKRIPDGLQATIRDNEIQLAARQATLEDRTKELAKLQTGFEEDRRRFLELTAPKAPAP
jgi:hypothetical protein